MTSPIVVTAPTGNVGRHVVDQLLLAGAPIRAAVQPGQQVRVPAGADPGLVEHVEFDFTGQQTWKATFEGAKVMFLVRPPALSKVKRDMLPSVAAAREAGVEHVVFLSLQGAKSNPFVPHHDVEKWLLDSGLSYTFIRASFFMQNLSTTHVSDIRDHDEIVVPAGKGTTAFVDTMDVAATAAAALLDPENHRNKAWTPTGSEALDYFQIAQILTEVLGRPIRYPKPGFLRYLSHGRRSLGMSWTYAVVSGAIYTAARLGQAASLTDDVQTVVGRKPITFREFAEREKDVWQRPA